MTDTPSSKPSPPDTPHAFRPATAAAQTDVLKQVENIIQPLLKRMERLERLVRDTSTGASHITGSLEAQAPLFLQVKDTVDRVEATADVLPLIKDAIDRVEQDGRQRYEVSHEIAQALLTRVSKLEVLIDPLIAHIKVALPAQTDPGKTGAEAGAPPRPEANHFFGPSLVDRLGKLESAVVLMAEGRYALSRLESTAMLLGPIRDAVDRIELAASQRYDVIVQRMDRLEGGSCLMSRLADAVARIELASEQRHEAHRALSQAIAERLDRAEAAEMERRNREARLNNRLLDLAVKANGNGASHAPVDSEHPLFTLSTQDGDMLLGRLAPSPDHPLPGALSSFLAAITQAKGRLQDDSSAQNALDAARDFVAAAAGQRNRSRITAGTKLVWILPGNTSADCPNDDELIQSFGILATNIALHRSVGHHGLTVLTGARRMEAAMPVLRWDQPADRLKAAERTLAALPAAVRRRLRPAIKLVALGRAEARGWADAQVRALQKALGDDGARDWGIIWPNAALADSTPFLLSLNALRDVALASGLTLAFQWVDGSVAMERTADVLRLCATADIRLDLTPQATTSSGALMQAYERALPYQPAPFDLRIPSFAVSGENAAPVICMARRDLAIEPITGDAFEHWTRGVAQRLHKVFDRSTRAQFLGWLKRGGSAAGQWEAFYVYNWRAPVPALVAAPVIDLMPNQDEVDLLKSAAWLDSVPDCGSAAVLELAESLPASDDNDNLQLQIDAHSYLQHGRPEASGDSLLLMSWFPERLGRTLELGSGYGVLARHFMDRAESYVGVDLTVEQGKAILDMGGAALIADIHRLPFGDGTFDTIIADNVIEHAIAPITALTEMRRLLKPGGKGFIVMPLDYRGPDYRNPSHHWKADELSIQHALRLAGLEIVRWQVAAYAALGGTGSYPSSGQNTSLWEVTVGPVPAVRREAPPAPVATLSHNDLGAPPVGEAVLPDLAADMAAVDVDLARIASEAGEDIIRLNATSDLTPLARNSPALRNFDWTYYIRFSGARIVRVLKALRDREINGTVLDMGAYFGNFCLALKRGGWEPIALDSYATYGAAFEQHRALMQSEGIKILDYADVGYGLDTLAPDSMDAVLCMGVIEHIPHTPRMLLESIMRVLKPGGLVIIDTPNLGYEYQRHKLLNGQTVFAPIQTQFETEIPFEGHHREYLPGEIHWMLERSGFGQVEIEMFNYSLYGLSEITGNDLVRYRAMEADPERREIILASALKPLKRQA